MRAYKCDVSGKYYDEPVQHEKVNLISYFYDDKKESYEDEPKDYDVHPQVQQLILDVLIKEIPWEQKLQQLKLNIELMQQDENSKKTGLSLNVDDLKKRVRCFPLYPEEKKEVENNGIPIEEYVQEGCTKKLLPIPEHITWEFQNGKYVFYHALSNKQYSSAFGANTAYNNVKKQQQRKEEDDEEKQTNWTNKRKRFLIHNYDMPEHLATRQANYEWRNGDHDAEQPPKEIMGLPDCSREEEADNQKDEFINSRVEQYLKQPGVSKKDAKQWAENEYKEIYG